VPTKDEWDMAVFRLLQTKLPDGSYRKVLMELQAERIRLGLKLSDHAYGELWERKHREAKSAAAPDFEDLQKSALEVSSHIGLLMTRERPASKPTDGFFAYEPLDWWVRCADQIQAIFHGRKIRSGLPEDLISNAGSLEIFLFFKRDGVSMMLLPSDTGSALVYHATQMVTNGTRVVNCEFCHTPFLSGGDARGGGKRRRDARFHSDECRWKFHAQARAEGRAKKSKKSRRR
jgi:hypothetical protein